MTKFSSIADNPGFVGTLFLLLGTFLIGISVLILPRLENGIEKPPDPFEICVGRGGIPIENWNHSVLKDCIFND